MANMQKVSLHLTVRQVTWLTEKAEQSGIRPAEFLRRIVDQVMEKQNEQT